ncbi:TIGR01459 family HAD-type hydrolase [Rhizobiaceae bacterium n13]|uniref:TIGR01459 family HAD-type hydrolase n=1 Tax=Ferirhizobium litorale TaxID=2927786 RepID=A0AAE3QIL5_9HYPH|nr:TIGR01459 family HAD-type hydrolase [Fererhizobium litorale]MDI7864137.1 TIGR01459 family HAD-type hydrolase [Fererhizobium litorale]MDI7923748.1 TIGR01459 family HAD-type hydrolase [Fererhizobium litorale]
MCVAPHTTLVALAARYDAFFIDQFGVLRDDDGAYPGANAALLYLKAIGKVVVILSNSGRSGEYNGDRLVKLGFDRSGFDHFLTSGDVAHRILDRETSGKAGITRCLTISSGGDRNLAERLGFETVEDATLADIVIISGSEAERIPLSAYRDRLRPAAERKVPCYCTNPDRHKLVKGGGTAPGAGSIALAYEMLGGPVRWFGKPHPAIYQQAQTLVSNIAADRIICIGDSIEHDIAGAAGAGLASCLVRTGVLAASSVGDFAAICEAHGAWPDFLMERFTA